MRVVAFDVGERRTGVAISDASGTLARPWQTIAGGEAATSIALVRELMAEDDGLQAVVIRDQDGRDINTVAKIAVAPTASRERR